MSELRQYAAKCSLETQGGNFQTCTVTVTAYSAEDAEFQAKKKVAWSGAKDVRVMDILPAPGLDCASCGEKDLKQAYTVRGKAYCPDCKEAAEEAADKSVDPYHEVYFPKPVENSITQPCPFCGMIDAMTNENVWPSSGKVACSVMCRNCKASGPETKDLASCKAAWNKRRIPE